MGAKASPTDAARSCCDRHDGIEVRLDYVISLLTPLSSLTRRCCACSRWRIGAPEPTQAGTTVCVSEIEDGEFLEPVVAPDYRIDGLDPGVTKIVLQGVSSSPGPCGQKYTLSERSSVGNYVVEPADGKLEGLPVGAADEVELSRGLSTAIHPPPVPGCLTERFDSGSTPPKEVIIDIETDSSSLLPSSEKPAAQKKSHRSSDAVNKTASSVSLLRYLSTDMRLPVALIGAGLGFCTGGAAGLLIFGINTGATAGVASAVLGSLGGAAVDTCWTKSVLQKGGLSAVPVNPCAAIKE